MQRGLCPPASKLFGRQYSLSMPDLPVDSSSHAGKCSLVQSAEGACREACYLEDSCLSRLLQAMPGCTGCPLPHAQPKEPTDKARRLRSICAWLILRLQCAGYALVLQCIACPHSDGHRGHALAGCCRGRRASRMLLRRGFFGLSMPDPFQLHSHGMPSCP